MYNSWKDLPIQQSIDWNDLLLLQEILSIIDRSPAIVSISEIESLKNTLVLVSKGQKFLLQGGDCAEVFSDITDSIIAVKLRKMLQMSFIINKKSKIPTVNIGRIAGQFAKPRSEQFETLAGKTLPAYRGDAINGYDFSAESREANPKRLLEAYNASIKASKIIKKIINNNIYEQDFIKLFNKELNEYYDHEKHNHTLTNLQEIKYFLKNLFIENTFFSSHEALILDYENSLIRKNSETNKYYNTSAHFLWIGERTRELSAGHIEFISKIENPVGIKLGPETNIEEVLKLADKINPTNDPGKLVFITRMGYKKIYQILPPILEGMKAANKKAIWICDPMHGNGSLATNGYKTRIFEHIAAEIIGFFEIHKASGTIPGGIHLECTGEKVTECVGGISSPISENELSKRYESYCDPRLNGLQSLEISSLIANLLTEKR